MRRKGGRHARHLYNAYDLDLKKSVILFAEQNGNKEAEARYGISEANIRRWRRLKIDIFGKPNYSRGDKLRSKKRVDYSMLEKSDSMDQDSQNSVDSMPLQERLSKVLAQEKMSANTSQLKSQPLSPTKLKVTRHSPKMNAKPVEPPQSPVNEEMCLRWNSHHSNMQTAFPSILSKEQYVDVTLAAEGKTLKCHRLILSSCSPYFDEVLSGISPFQHPVLFMRDIPFWILKSLCDFMYAGEVHVYQNKLEELLSVAEALKIKGLAGKSTPPENREETNNKKSEATPTKEVKKRNQQEKGQHPPPVSKKQNMFTASNNYESTSQDYDNEDLLDPLDLLEPLYEEVAEEKKPSTVVKPPKENKYQYQSVKKPFARKLRKRKYSEQRDPSPPPVFSFRKGTRSRPNVKIPKYYHSDFNNSNKSTPNSQHDPLLDVDEIKTEPIDVEDNLIDYSDEENQYVENSLHSKHTVSPIIITSKPLAMQDKFRKIKLSKPIITEVHTIDESSTTAGGLEVIKITMQQTGEESSKKEGSENSQNDKTGELSPLAGLTIVSTEGAVNEETEGGCEDENAKTQRLMEVGAVAAATDGDVDIDKDLPVESVAENESGIGDDLVNEKLPVVQADSVVDDEAAIGDRVVNDELRVDGVPEDETAKGDVVNTELPEVPALSGSENDGHVENEQLSAVPAESVVEDEPLIDSDVANEMLLEEPLESTTEIEAPALDPVDDVPKSPDHTPIIEPKLQENTMEESLEEMHNIEEDQETSKDIEQTEEKKQVSEQESEETPNEENANNNRIVEEQDNICEQIQIKDVRTTSMEEMSCYGEATPGLDHLENEAMNMVNAITAENPEAPPDIDEKVELQPPSEAI